MTAGNVVPLRIAPLAGGGQCDRCGWRTFRRTRSGVWRHEDCEPASYRVLRAMRLAALNGRQTPPRARPAATCPGCCVCRRRP